MSLGYFSYTSFENCMEKYFYFLIGTLLVLLGLLAVIFSSLPDHKLHVFVLDIGQGDAIFIQAPTQERILIDGGPDNKVIEELGKVMPFYAKTIDVIIVSHPHADHINGLIEVMKRYDVRRVLMTGVSYKYAGYTTFLELVHQKKIPIFFVGEGKDYQIGMLVFDILYPSYSLQGKSFENLNNSSLTFRLLYGDKKFYFGGDLEMEKEAELVSSSLDLKADFFKTSHHGSKTSSTEPLLDRIHPQYAAISCGVENKFGHPYYLTIRHFQQRNIAHFRTDLDGTIEAISDGRQLNVKILGK